MKISGYLLLGLICFGGAVACGQQLVDLPYEADEVDLGADMSGMVVDPPDLSRPGDGGNTDASPDS